MKINRSNYEEYFLLYLDNELSVHQKQEMEVFVQENPDLAAELEMFRYTKLLPTEELQFDKSFLFRKEGNNINLDNYTEFFLLQIDKELNEKDMDGLNVFLNQHPQLEGELELLRQTILPVEKIEFAGKSILYRTERKERRIIPFNWARIAIAASLIVLIIGLAWLIIPSRKQELALVSKPIVQPKQERSIVAQQYVAINQQNNNSIAATTATGYNKIKHIKTVDTKSHQSISNKNVVAVGKDNQIGSIPFTNQNTAATRQQQVTVTDNGISELPRTVQQPQVAQTGINSVQNVYAANTSSDNIVHPAAYRELNTSEEDNKSLYFGAMEINKNKVRGLFKGMSRLFGSKAKDNTDKKDIKVANLDINTQNL